MIVRGISLPDGDVHLAKEIAGNPTITGKGTYQFRKLLPAVSCCRDFRTAVDGGAHVGLWSRVLAGFFHHVHAFEPVHELRGHFRRNVDAVNLYACALGHESKQVKVRYTEHQTGSSHIWGEGADVEMRTLDSFGLTQVDFVKLDVEGCEYWALKGAEETIRRDKPTIILEQKNNLGARYGAGDAVELVKSWGAKLIVEVSGDFILSWNVVPVSKMGTLKE